MTLSSVTITSTAKYSKNYRAGIEKAPHTSTTWPFIHSVSIADSVLINAGIIMYSPSGVPAIVFVQVLLLICKTKYEKHINLRAIENFSNIHNRKTADFLYYLLIILKTITSRWTRNQSSNLVSIQTQSARPIVIFNKSIILKPLSSRKARMTPTTISSNCQFM